MSFYTVLNTEPPTHITFLKNNIQTRVNISDSYPNYCLIDKNTLKKYFMEINENKLIIIDNHLKIMSNQRNITLGHINFKNKIYRPATQCDIDKNEEQYNSDNWKLYSYLKSL
jgi:hypothetical protein